jgi:hypothetical protein
VVLVPVAHRPLTEELSHFHLQWPTQAGTEVVEVEVVEQTAGPQTVEGVKVAVGGADWQPL